MTGIPRIPALLVLLAIFWPVAAIGADFTGRGEALDGDSLQIDEAMLRLAGIDAPELDQTCLTSKRKPVPCGKYARSHLARLIRNQKLRCVGDARDAEGHWLVTCKAGFISINEQLVLDGWALADPDNGDAYRRAETYAKARREGLWRIQFDPPWEWRAKAK